MSGGELFGELPEGKRVAEAGAPSAPRLLEPVRDQIELRAVDIESLIGESHPARVIWAYVERLDLSELEARIKARDDRPGHPATSPTKSAKLAMGRLSVRPTGTAVSRYHHPDLRA